MERKLWFGCIENNRINIKYNNINKKKDWQKLNDVLYNIAHLVKQYF